MSNADLGRTSVMGHRPLWRGIYVEISEPQLEKSIYHHEHGRHHAEPQQHTLRRGLNIPCISCPCFSSRHLHVVHLTFTGTTWVYIRTPTSLGRSQYGIKIEKPHYNNVDKLFSASKSAPPERPRDTFRTSKPLSMAQNNLHQIVSNTAMASTHKGTVFAAVSLEEEKQASTSGSDAKTVSSDATPVAGLKQGKPNALSRCLTKADVPNKLGRAFLTHRKWIIATVIAMLQISMNLNASIFRNSNHDLRTQSGLSSSFLKHCQGWFLIAYAFGCELWAPWSEDMGGGRRCSGV
jgi:hypothetical protein